MVPDLTIFLKFIAVFMVGGGLLIKTPPLLPTPLLLVIPLDNPVVPRLDLRKVAKLAL